MRTFVTPGNGAVDLTMDIINQKFYDTWLNSRYRYNGAQTIATVVITEEKTAASAS